MITRNQSQYHPYFFTFVTILVHELLFITQVVTAPQRVVKQRNVREKWLTDESFYDHMNSEDVHTSVFKNDLCPPVPKSLLTGGCDLQECSTDRNCGEIDSRCCYNGCIYTCLPIIRPPPQIDWVRQPRGRLRFGQSWLVNGEETSANVEPCSTTPVEDDSDPLLCPHGYECRIDDPGAPKMGIPNSGRCIKTNTDSTTGIKSLDAVDEMMSDGIVIEKGDAELSRACDIGDGKFLLSGYSLNIQTQNCKCENTKLSCDTEKSLLE